MTMHRLTQFVQGHQRVFLELKQPDVQTAFVQALKELSSRQTGAAAAVVANASGIRHDHQNVSDVAQQGVQRQIHSGRKHPSLGHASFGAAYEPWSDDMACILQGSCLPGSTRYCRTLSMFTKMELKDVMQSTAAGGDLPSGKRRYHTLVGSTRHHPLDIQSRVNALHFPVSIGSSQYATDSSQEKGDKADPAAPAGEVSQRQKLKMAVRDYGSTVVVFHVCISLMSLGGFYLAVSSGVDVQSLLSFLGFSREVIESKLATGTSTFVMAYAVHKCFAPVRIGITVTCTPFIVRYLRGVGLLKRPLPAK